MKVVQEEIFGPVIVAMPFDDDDEGIAIANGTDFGLYDYVFSADTNRAFRASKRLRAGNVGINTTQRNHNAPFGGKKYERRRPRRRRVRPARVHRAAVGRVAGMTRSDRSTVSIVPDGVARRTGCSFRCRRCRRACRCAWERDGGTVDDMVRVAQACDAAGFLYVAVCHHVAIPREPAEMMSTQWFDPIATLGYLAAHTTRTRLMTNVFVAAYQHPLETAKAFATARRAVERSR